MVERRGLTRKELTCREGRPADVDRRLHGQSFRHRESDGRREGVHKDDLEEVVGENWNENVRCITQVGEW